VPLLQPTWNATSRAPAGRRPPQLQARDRDLPLLHLHHLRAPDPGSAEGGAGARTQRPCRPRAHAPLAAECFRLPRLCRRLMDAA